MGKNSMTEGSCACLQTILALSVCFLLQLAPARAGAARTAPQEKILENRAYPLLMDSPGEVGIHDGEDEIVFVFKDVAEIRQGSLRITAGRAVVRISKDSAAASRVSIYAEGGGGRPGEPAPDPVIVKIGDDVMEASAIHFLLQTLRGASWECPHYEIDDAGAVRLNLQALAAYDRYGGEESYFLDVIPDLDLPAPGEPAPTIDTFFADTPWFFLLEEDDKVIGVYMGNVHGSYGNIEINAELAVLWLDQTTGDYEIYARGDVILRKAGEGRDILGRSGLETLRVDRFYVNPSRERGLAVNPELRVRDERRDEIYVVRGERAYILDDETLMIQEAGTTNCPHGIPHYEFRAARLRFTQQPSRLFASAWNIRLVAGQRQTPLFWLPYLGMNLDDQTYLLRSVSAGSSSGLGMFIQTEWAPGDLGVEFDWLDDWTVSVDYYSRRGTGLGTDIGYSFGPGAGISNKGRLKTYYIHDRADEDSLGRPLPKTDRGHIHLRHRTDWTAKWRTDLEYHYLSDHIFLREYFQRDFLNEKAPETMLLTRYSSDHLWAGLQLKTRINEFLTQREALPGLELHVLGAPLGPFAYDTILDAGLYEFRLSEEESFRDELDRLDPPQLTRLHSDHTISLPFRMGFLKLDPHLRFLATYASRGAEENGSFRRDVSRAGVGGGFRAAADFSRIYNTRQDDLHINRLRHIVTPYLESEMLQVDGESSEFIQMRGVDPWPRYGLGPRERDDWIDAIDTRDMVKLGLRQRFQTKREGRSEDWLRVDFAKVFRSDRSVAVLDDDNYIGADIEWKLTPRLALASENNRFSTQDGLNLFNFEARWEPVSRLDTSLEYNYITDTTSSVTGNVGIELSDRYTLSVHERYEFDRDGTGRGRNMRTDVVLSRWFHKWLLQMEFYYDGRGDGDRGVFVRFSPSFLDPAGRRGGLAIR